MDAIWVVCPQFTPLVLYAICCVTGQQTGRLTALSWLLYPTQVNTLGGGGGVCQGIADVVGSSSGPDRFISNL